MSWSTITFPDGWEQDDNYDLPYSKRLADSGALKVIKEPDGVPSLRLLCVGTLSSHSYMVVGGKTGYPGLTIGPNAEKVLPPKNWSTARRRCFAWKCTMSSAGYYFGKILNFIDRIDFFNIIGIIWTWFKNNSIANTFWTGTFKISLI